MHRPFVMAGHSRPKDGVLRTPMSRPSTLLMRARPALTAVNRRALAGLLSNVMPVCNHVRRGCPGQPSHVFQTAHVSFQTAMSFKQPCLSNSHASSPVLFGKAPGRPVFPFSLFSPRQSEGDGAPRGATIVLCVPAFPLGNTGRRSARHPDKLAHVRVYLRRFPCCAGPRFSWPSVM